MNRAAQNLLLLLFGGAILRITVSGTYLRYVRPMMYPYLLASGIIIVGLAVVAMAAHARDVRAEYADDNIDTPERRALEMMRAEIGASSPATEYEPRSTKPHHNDVACPHHDHGLHPGCESSAGHHHTDHLNWLLVTAIVVVLCLAPPALKDTSVNTISVASASADVVKQKYDPLPPGTPEVSFYDFTQRAFRDSTNSLYGRHVNVEGFITRAPNGKPAISRLLIVCCVADARKLWIYTEGFPGMTPPEGTWVRATIEYVPGSATLSTNFRPTVTVSSFERIPEPKNPYVY